MKTTPLAILAALLLPLVSPQTSAEPAPFAHADAETFSYRDSDYKLVKKVVSWSDAKKQCEEMGGHLAVLETRHEIRHVAKALKGRVTWIGLFRDPKDGKTKWINNAEFVPKKLRFGKEDFELYEGHSFGYIAKDHIGGKRGGIPTSPAKYFLCEIPKKEK